MPAPGGTSDKLGNIYESLWVIDHLLCIVEGTARTLVYESLDNIESQGVEFTVTQADQRREYWSIKRQTSKTAGWTLALLTEETRGRSILGDLLGHAMRASENHGVFASTQGAGNLAEICEYAKKGASILVQRLNQSKNLKSDFKNRVLPLCKANCNALQRLHVRTIDEDQLRSRVDNNIRKLFYHPDGISIDPSGVRGFLADFLREYIHRPIDRNAIIGALQHHSVHLKNWEIEQDKINTILGKYLWEISSQWMTGRPIPLSGQENLLTEEGKPAGRKMLVIGTAGAGKSTVLASTVETLRAAGIPVLPLRFDTLPDGILSTTELGRKLGLPDSPVIALAGIANGGDCVLLIDQLDAISEVSGRRTELWSLFESLCQEAKQYPNLALLIGCRAFDLERDHRMRQLKKQDSGFLQVELKPLPIDKLDIVLSEHEVDAQKIPAKLKELLSLPLHLTMYLQLSSEARRDITNREQLFSHFWGVKRDKTEFQLGREPKWTQILDTLCDWFSRNQQLSAPHSILDDFSKDAKAMVSQNVLILSENRYRFFHESFFDYVFARRFSAKGKNIIELLLSTDQALFRRAQVRQILGYLRDTEISRYLESLRALLLHDNVRFHIKKHILNWLSALDNPSGAEWQILQEFAVAYPDLRHHMRSVPFLEPAWFDVLDKQLFFDQALGSGDQEREQETIGLFNHPVILEKHSERVVELLTAYRQSGEPWNQYLRSVCSWGHVYHSQKMFNCFLAWIDEGIFDEANRDSWRHMLYDMAKKAPTYACEAIAHWFDRQVVLWNNKDDGQGLHHLLDKFYSDNRKILLPAQNAPQSFVGQLLPRMARIINELARSSVSDRLDTDPIWSFRSYGDDPLSGSDSLLVGLSQALEKLAQDDPELLDFLLEPYAERPQDTIAYLCLRAWTAAGKHYADRIAVYLAKDPRRLKIGYSSWGGRSGSAEIYISYKAVKTSSPYCADKNFMALEQAIFTLKSQWEIQNPHLRGRKQLQLLECLDQARLSQAGRILLRELKRKFPDYQQPKPAKMEVTGASSPVPAAALQKMNDAQWLQAMQKYTGKDHWGHRRESDGHVAGGEWELSTVLQQETKANPARFAALAEQMLDSFPGSYFNALVRGITESRNNQENLPVSLTQTAGLIRRVHRLPARPCGRSIAWLLQKWGDCDWPADILDILAWYAMHDPDPEKETWHEIAQGGQGYYGGDPYSAGINCTRGSAAEAIAQLLFKHQDYFSAFRPAIEHLVQDTSVAVRSCAATTLLATLNVDVPQSIAWFNALVQTDDALLATPHVGRFIHYAGYRDYAAIRPVLLRMLETGNPKTVEIAATQICVLALTEDAAAEEAARVRAGDEIMRKAAAHVYATNAAHTEIGAACRGFLKTLFSDASEEVREQASAAFSNLPDWDTRTQSDLLSALLASQPDAKSLEPVIRAIEDSPVQLPDLVCDLAERCVAAYQTDGGDIRTAGSMVAHDLSKIVVRLYSQTQDTRIQARCLDLVDQMERYNFYGLAQELETIER